MTGVTAPVTAPGYISGGRDVERVSNSTLVLASGGAQLFSIYGKPLSLPYPR